MYCSYYFFSIVNSSANTMRLQCEHNITINKTACAMIVVKNSAAPNTTGPFFEVTVDVEYDAGMAKFL